MDASFAPQYIFLLKSICTVPRIALHGRIFSMFLTENYIASRKKPLPSHQERCLAPRNRYAASLRPETVTILQRVVRCGACGHNNCALTGLCSWLGGRGCERRLQAISAGTPCVVQKVAERGFQLLELDLRWKFQGVSVVCVLLARLMNRWNIIQYTGMTLFKCCFNTSLIAKIVINTQVFIKFWRKNSFQKFCRPLFPNKKSCLIC